MAKKKEHNAEDLVMDLITKLKSVFKKDLYIKDLLYILPGQYTDDELCGDIMCIMEPEYKFAVESIFGKCDLIYIDDIVEYKKEPEIHFKIFTKEDHLYKEMSNKEEKIKSRINVVETWESFIKSFNEDILNTIFTDNASVDLKIDNQPTITIAKKLFPQVSLKNIENLTYTIIPVQKNELYAFCLDFQFTHFKMYMVYYFLQLDD